MVSGGEIPLLQFDILIAAVIMEGLDSGLDEPGSAVVTLPADRGCQVVQVPIGVPVLLLVFDVQIGGLTQRNDRLEIPEDQRYRPAAITV